MGKLLKQYCLIGSHEKFKTLLPQGLQSPNLVRWWLRLRGSQTPRYMSFDHVVTRRHVTRKRYLHIHKKNKHQAWNSGDLSWGLTKSHALLIMRLIDKIKTLFLHFRKTYKHQTWHSGNLDWWAATDKVICPFDHMVTWCHVTKWKRYIFIYRRPNSIKLGNVITSVEVLGKLSLYKRIITWLYICYCIWATSGVVTPKTKSNLLANQKVRSITKSAVNF